MPRTLLSEDRCVMVCELADGTVTVALRPEPEQVWGPPIKVGMPMGPSPAPPAPGSISNRYWGD